MSIMSDVMNLRTEVQTIVDKHRRQSADYFDLLTLLGYTSLFE